MGERKRPLGLLVYGDDVPKVQVPDKLPLRTILRSKSAQSQVLFTPSFPVMHRDGFVVFLNSCSSCLLFMSHR
jgi:hypothetical protein